MIGGEFEIGPIPSPSGKLPLPDAYASGRAALYQILRSVGSARRVWLPDYICSSVTEAVEAAGFSAATYTLTEDLRPCPESIQARKGEIILLVNYFGMVECAPSVDLLRQAFPGCLLIEDDVQAFYAFEAGTKADYAFTSLRKAFPVPEGGLVQSAFPLPEPVGENTFASLKIEGGLLKARRGESIDDSQYLSLFERGEALVGQNLSAGMTARGQALWTAVDRKEAALCRQRNAAILSRGLRQMGAEPLLLPSQGQVPLFLPILSGQRDALRRHLFAHEVYCPVHWRETRLGGRELSLIVDQRYGEKDMELMLNLIDDIL